MKVELRRDKLSGQGILQVLQGAHNHGPFTAATARSEYWSTALTLDTRAEIGNLSRDGLSTSQILQHSVELSLKYPIIMKDISNISS